MILQRFLVPFIYSVIIGGAWSLWSNKKFSSSIAPAYMLHMLVVIVSGLLFDRLSIGLYGGIGVAIVLLVVYVIKDKKQDAISVRVLGYLKEMWNGGGFTFFIFYILCFFLNSQKFFISWDEFSHWGMFLKESLRLDRLYCVSPLEFAHKDYVAALTMFETIWCRLNFRYAEADAYRAIQTFMFSLLLPMFESFDKYNVGDGSCDTDRKSRIKNILFRLSPVAIVLLIPLIFSTKHAFLFYHSIYCDIAVAIVLYWCMFESYREHDELSYKVIEIAIGASVLVLSKMIAIALLPLVVVFLAIRVYFFSDRKMRIKENILLLLPAVLPVALWMWFNKYVEAHMGKTGSIQSYSGMQLSQIKDVFLNPGNGNIPYLEVVRNEFIDAIIYRDILIHGSYCVVVLFIVIMFLAISYYMDGLRKKLIKLVGLWTFLSGVYYAILMYFCYETSFSEYEAENLASFERYMNSFVIAVLMLLIAVYYDSELWKKHMKYYYLLLILLPLNLAFFHADAFEQVMPGIISRDDEYVIEYTGSASFIMDSTNEEDRVYIIRRGDDGRFIWHEKYYCSPRVIGGGSLGPMVDENDVWSYDATVEQFVNELRSYDCVYFSKIDEQFIDKYAEAFEKPEQIIEGKIYRISEIGSKVILE